MLAKPASVCFTVDTWVRHAIKRAHSYCLIPETCRGPVYTTVQVRACYHSDLQSQSCYIYRYCA